MHTQKKGECAHSSSCILGLFWFLLFLTRWSFIFDRGMVCIIIALQLQLPVLVILKINVKLFFTLMILFGYLLPCLWTFLHCYLYVRTTTTTTLKCYTFARTKKIFFLCIWYLWRQCVDIHIYIFKNNNTDLDCIFFFLFIRVYTQQRHDSNKALVAITFFSSKVIWTNQSFDAINQQNVDIWWTRQGIWSPVLQSSQ